MKLSALIIDDEIRAGKTLQNIIENNAPEVTVLDVICESVKAPDLIQHYKPNIIFLDVEMPGMNGFEVLSYINHINAKIIFVTAYDHYAIEAIKNDATDYILKPISISEVVRAIEKVKKVIANENESIDKITDEDITDDNMIKIPTLAGIDFVIKSNIVRLEATGRNTTVICDDGSNLTMIKNIKDAEEIFHNDSFFRSHRSHLINIKHVRRYINARDGVIIMSDGEKIPLSRRKKEEFYMKMGMK